MGLDCILMTEHHKLVTYTLTNTDDLKLVRFTVVELVFGDVC